MEKPACTLAKVCKVVRYGDAYKITIPVLACDQMHLGPGDQVLLVVSGGVAYFEKFTTADADRLLEFKRMGATILSHGGRNPKLRTDENTRDLPFTPGPVAVESAAS